MSNPISAITGGLSVISGLSGSKASKNAANAQSQAAFLAAFEPDKPLTTLNPPVIADTGLLISTPQIFQRHTILLFLENIVSNEHLHLSKKPSE